jgi:hypothetical protein
MGSPIEWVHVPCDYDQPRAIWQAVTAERLIPSYHRLPPYELTFDQIPLIGRGKVDHQIGELDLFEDSPDSLFTYQVLERVNTEAYGLATPLAAVRYAIERPDRHQRGYPLHTFFELNGHLWSFCLSMHLGWRAVDFRHLARPEFPTDLLDHFGKGIRILVARNPAEKT